MRAARSGSRLRSSRAWPVGIGAIALLAFVVRVLYGNFVVEHVTLGLDAAWYTLVAKQIAHGQGFIDPTVFLTTGGSVATASHAPLYPAVLAAVARVFNSQLSTFRIFGAFAGTSTVVFTGFIGRRIGGDAVGLLAAALVAVFPSLIAIDGSLMSETLTVPLITGMVWLALVAIERPTWWRYALLGVLGGLATLARPDAAIAAVLIIGAAVVASEHFARRLLDGAIAVVLLVVVVTPWIVRNAVQVNAPTLATTSASGTLAGANCHATYHGKLLGYWDAGCSYGGGRGTLDEATFSTKLRRLGVHYARDHVAEVPGVVAVRELRAFGLFRPSQQVRLEDTETRSYHWQFAAWALWIPVLVLGAYGFVLIAGTNGRRALPLFAVVGAFVITVAISYGNQRFRTSCETVFLVATAVALTTLTSRIRSRRRAA